jgi:hypothetical protein
MWPQWHIGVVSSNPPPLVDIQPDFKESGFFFARMLAWFMHERLALCRPFLECAESFLCHDACPDNLLYLREWRARVSPIDQGIDRVGRTLSCGFD